MARQDFVQIHLVHAFQYRIGIVDDDEPLAGRTARELVRVVIHTGGVADEKGVEFAQALDVVPADHRRTHADRASRPGKLVERGAIRWRIGLVFIVENGDRR